jgi:hypothetical protein
MALAGATFPIHAYGAATAWPALAMAALKLKLNA